jgi:hypothetical protein
MKIISTIEGAIHDPLEPDNKARIVIFAAIAANHKSTKTNGRMIDGFRHTEGRGGRPGGPTV